MSFLSELKRRNVIRVAVLYGVASWLLLQVGDLLFDAFDIPAWGIRLLLAMLLLGFPLALIFAWVYELTPEGLKREREIAPGDSITAHTARKLDVIVIALLVLSVGLVLTDRFLIPDESSAPIPAGAAADSQPPSQKASATASIAVLPFINMSEDKSNEYFSDGLTEELLNVLAKVPGLRVIARTSSFAYKGKDAKIADVARELEVDHVLEGSVRKSGTRVRITTQLIRASDSSHLWSETYDRDVEDIFAVQDEISRKVVDALKVRLLSGDATAAEVGGTKVPEAYEAYLQGRFRYNEGEAEENLRAALASYEEAIRLDPGYARAHAGRAAALNSLASNGYMPFDVGFRQARDAALRATELAPDLADGHVTLANLKANVDLDLDAASTSAQRALELNPGSSLVQRSYASLQSSLGHHPLAIAAAEKAVELDPLAAQSHVSLSNVLFNARRYEQSADVARRALTVDPDRPGTHAALGFALLLLQRSDEALVEFERDSVEWQRMTGRALVFAAQARKDLARAELQAMQEKLGDAASYQYAEIHAQLGEPDQAFRWLERAREVRDPGLTGLVFVDPFVDPLRSDPRYDTLVRELGFTG